MRIFCLVVLLTFFCVSWAQAAEDLEGFVITPQSVEYALYDYFLSPPSVDVTLACVGTEVIFEKTINDQTRTYVCHFDCDTTNFEWQIVAGKPWVHIEPARGEGETLTQLRVTVDEDYLKNIVPEDCGEVQCFKSDITVRITYYLENCVEYADNGTTAVSVTYYSEKPLPDFVTVYYSSAGLSPELSPTEVSFQGEIANGTVIFVPTEASVQVLSGHQGWDAIPSASWLSIEKDEILGSEGTLKITPGGLTEPGRYRGYVRVKDRATGRTSTLLVKADVAGTPSALAKLFYGVFPDGQYQDRVEVSAAQWFDARVHLGPSPGSYPIYVEATHSAFPGYAFAYHFKDGVPVFTVASYNGTPVEGAEDLYYAATGVEEVHIGAFPLAYLPGLAHIRIKQGGSWTSGTTILDLELVIQGLSGSWKIVDNYDGVEYEHPSPLVVSEGLSGLSASWGDYQPEIRYSADPGVLYEIFFSARDFVFRYEITQVSTGYISGTWSYSADGVNFSAPQTFYGIKLNP